MPKTKRKRAESDSDEPDERDFYDQPCRVVFGAMCARTKPSGDMLIEQLN